MAIERKVFRGIGAVIASVESDRVFEIAPKVLWVPPTSFAADKRIRINLDRCPSKVGSWSDIEVDDRGVDSSGDFLGSAMCLSQLTGYHVTKLGGYGGKDIEDLVRGPFVGAVYLEDSFFERHRSRIDPPGDPWPTTGFKACQMTTVAYSDNPDNGDRRNKRYAGFLGRVTARSGSIALIELRDLGGRYTQPYSFDLSSPAHCDSDPPLSRDEAALRPDSPDGATGALFVELRYAAQLEMESPKLPIGLES